MTKTRTILLGFAGALAALLVFGGIQPKKTLVQPAVAEPAMLSIQPSRIYKAHEWSVMCSTLSSMRVAEGLLEAKKKLPTDLGCWGLYADEQLAVVSALDDYVYVATVDRGNTAKGWVHRESFKV